MGGLTLQYALRRFEFFKDSMACIQCHIYHSKISSRDPIQSMISRMSESAGYVENSEKIAKGLRKIWSQ